MLTPRDTRPSVTGGGAAVAAAPTGRLPKTYSLDELAQRTDALALAVGARITASVILVACLVVVLIGAQSLLSTMESMNRDLNEMNEQLAIANGGLKVLNTTMDSVEPTSRHLTAIVGTVDGVRTEVKSSASTIGEVATGTKELNTKMEGIASSTSDMRGSLEGAAAGTDTLATTIGSLNRNITPLVKTQHQMLLGTRSMRNGLDGMNASLAYTIRIMNYITDPPTQGPGMQMKADLPKQTLPPLPGIRAEVEPITVFPRHIWPVYKGP